MLLAIDQIGLDRDVQLLDRNRHKSVRKQLNIRTIGAIQPNLDINWIQIRWKIDTYSSQKGIRQKLDRRILYKVLLVIDQIELDRD